MKKIHIPYSIGAASFIFQDNTFSNSLRFCASNLCENIPSGNQTALYAVNSVYEVAGDKLNINTFDFVRDNIWFMGVIGVLLAFAFIGYFVFFRKK